MHPICAKNVMKRGMERMTCKDCLHLRVCKACEIERPEEICNHFKNKEDFQEVKHGEWITPTKIKGMNIAVPHCSLCGNVPCDKALYCPYCGAKMDGKENNNG